MRKISLIVAALSAVVILSGCGHNAIQYGDGVGFDIGINPENCMLSMNLRYGKILSAVTRDNVELELTGNVAADGTATADKQTGMTTDGALKVKIGRQINGAAVDLIEAGADPNKVMDALTDPASGK